MDRAEALAWAADVRRVRDEVVEAVRAGDLDLGAVADRAAVDDMVGRIHVVDVVEALPGWGKVVARRALAGLGLDESTPLVAVDAAVLIGRFGSPP